MGGRRVVTALAVAGLAACGYDAPAARDHFTSGTRLRAQWWEFAGGTTLFRGFVDTARGEPCWFDELVGPSGVDRCLPSGALTFFRRSATSFADPACTEPVVSASGAEPAVLAVPDDACASEPALFELGPVAATHYRRDAGGACVVEAGGLFHTLGPAIPLDRLAAATPTVEPAGGRIDGYALVADDGARQVIGGWDRDRGERVVDSPELPDGRWSPRAIAYAEYVLCLLILQLTAGSHAAFSQQTRNFPLNSKLGHLSAVTFPLFTIDGQQVLMGSGRPDSRYGQSDHSA